MYVAAHVCRYLCMWLHRTGMCACGYTLQVHVLLCTRACERQRSVLSADPLETSTFAVVLYLRKNLSLAWSWPSGPSWLISKPQDPPVSSSPALELEVCTPMPAFLCGFWALNSGTPVCTVDTLPAELLSQPPASASARQSHCVLLLKTMAAWN